jgi:4-hydroxy-tetrahydrodipicolinate reductase
VEEETGGRGAAVPIRVVVAGATGWVGRALLPALWQAADLTVVGAVARSSAGRDIGEALGGAPLGLTVVGTVEEALAAHAHVLVDYAGALSVRRHVTAAVEAGLHAVVGSSGLSADDYAALDRLARARGVGVVAAGNFSLVATLAKRLALLAARELEGWEIIDYADTSKPDAPSGTAREWAEALPPRPREAAPRELTQGDPAARGASVGRTSVHSLRLPGHVLGIDFVGGRGEERLVIRYDGGSSAAPYVAGTLYAIRHVGGVVGVVRGLDQLVP